MEFHLPRKVNENAAYLFLAVFLFLFLFRPFTVEETELKYPFFLICFLHALSPALIVIAFFTIVRYLGRKKVKGNKRSVVQGIQTFFILFSIIGLASFLLRDLIYTNPDNWSLRYFWEELRNSYLAGSLFVSYFIFANFYFHTKRTQSQKNIEIPEVSLLLTPMELFIETQVRIDDFTFNPTDFLFAQAEGNYVEFTMLCDQGTKKMLKRMTLKQLESQLKSYSSLMKCHRAYLVNVQKIDQVSGNSQGYFVSFQETEDKVPVSRAHLPLFDQCYQEFKK